MAIINIAETLTEEEKELKKKLLKDKQMARIYRKKIEAFVMEKLGSRQLIMASEIPVNSRKDFETLIYIRLFGIESKIYEGRENKSANKDREM